ncbi:L,D-transpeptidase [Brucella sp. NM4]|nr:MULTISPECIES: L,D-transpeptidase [Brucella]WHS29936.1 L,D-transpeptidase [Brucella sp. NM4]WHT44576.1 L,D-transpeptidase [Ochrobactrum sp. SSR]
MFSINDEMLVRCVTKKCVLGAVLLAPLILSSCTTADQSSRAELAQKTEQAKQAYRNEPYEVFLVDRKKFDTRFSPVDVTPMEQHAAGTILIDTSQKFLYLYNANGTARRYGVAVGASGYGWWGTAKVGRKAIWPAWYPTDDMRNKAPGLPRRIEPGTHNPLGARALYLYQNGVDTLYRIHGTSEPWTIGTEASSGCIRMLNEDVIELYNLVSPGATVIVK